MEQKYLLLKEKLLDVNDSINKIAANFKKSPNRINTREFLENKLTEICRLKTQGDQIYDEIYGTITLKELTQKQLQEVLKQIDKQYNSIKTTITEQLKILEKRTENNLKMADFSYETALKLPSLTITSEVAARDFLDNVEVYYDLLNDAGKTILLNFIIKTKIQGHAKTKLGNKVAENFKNLKVLVYESCGTTETHESLKTKLNGIKQGGKSLEGFAESITLITEQLAALEIKRQRANAAAETAIRSMADREALSAFKKGLKSEVKVVVEAAQPNSIQEALQVASSAQANIQDHDSHVQIACFVCKQTNHLASQCRFNPNRRVNQNNTNFRQNSYNRNSSGYRTNDFRQNTGYSNFGRNNNITRHNPNQNNTVTRPNHTRNWNGNNGYVPRVNTFQTQGNEPTQPEPPGQQQLGGYRH
jgi:hypothetical protein